MNIKIRSIFIISLFLIAGYLIFPNTVKAQIKFPKYQGYVNDFVGILKPNENYSLTEFLKQVERKTSAEIAIVIIDSLQRYPIEGYSVELFKKWGIGKRNKDNGVLIVVSLKDRKIRIEVGYGLEGVLPDGLCGEIIRQNVMPYFQKEDYKSGLWLASIKIGTIIAKEANVTLELGNTKKHLSLYKAKQKSLFEKLLPFLLILLLLGFRSNLLPYLLLGSMFRNKRSYWSNGSGSGFGGSSFGGFGGGLSGGGGATGSW